MTQQEIKEVIRERLLSNEVYKTLGANAPLAAVAITHMPPDTALAILLYYLASEGLASDPKWAEAVRFSQEQQDTLTTTE